MLQDGRHKVLVKLGDKHVINVVLAVMRWLQATSLNGFVQKQSNTDGDVGVCSGQWFQLRQDSQWPGTSCVCRADLSFATSCNVMTSTRCPGTCGHYTEDRECAPGYPAVTIL